MAGIRDELIPTRHSLLTRLKNWDDQEGWKEFFDLYWKLLYHVALRSGLNDADAQDVVQETVAAVARRMPDFRYDPAIGSFKAWLFTILRRRILDRHRKHRREAVLETPRTETGSRTRILERIPDPATPEMDRVLDEEWNKHLLEAALTRIKRLVSPKQFQIFDCYALKGWPVSDVVKHLKVSEQQVYTAKHRIAALLQEQMHQLETRML